MRKVIQAGSGRAETLLLIPNTSLPGLHRLGSPSFVTHQDWADIKKGATGRLQILEPEAAARRKSSPRSIAATPGVEGREGAPQLEETSHKQMESHTSLDGGVGWAASLPGRLSTVREPGLKDTQHHVGGMLVRLPCYSKCGFRTSSISWKTVRNTEPQALPDHLNQNPTLNKIHRCFFCTFEFESHCLRRWLDPSR